MRLAEAPDKRPGLTKSQQQTRSHLTTPFDPLNNTSAQNSKSLTLGGRG
jgi:hypothetical protein